ncbi:hypothetical protein [Streptomyces sp. H39-S7]|uniref:hypothetical protein n=1 Tax=Streptomyces sp. H39-S7 TaxID=3004357 RepID=UPI0022AE69B0|nr:hypothetical protein [Streptomyces sp. H39-S7]MCZ4119616.1 hypothetical protein [Streptomyces sp. H39-S7]
MDAPPTDAPPTDAPPPRTPQDARPRSMSPDAQPTTTRRQAGPQDRPLPGGDDDESRWIYEVAGEYSSETWAPPESVRR